MNSSSYPVRGLRFLNRVLRRSGIAKLWRRPVVNYIDIGSAGGLPPPWSENEDLLYHQLRFEPREAPARNTNIVSLDSALWSSEDERDFYNFSGGGMGSSLFEQNYAFVREHFESLRHLGDPALAESWLARSTLVNTQRVNCRTLDGILAQQPVHYDFLKIDAQGAEYEILKGAASFLADDCQGLHLELFVIPLYKGIRLLPEVQELLSDAGFDLVKKFPAHGSFASQHDCLFIKRGARKSVARVLYSIYGLGYLPQGSV